MPQTTIWGTPTTGEKTEWDDRLVKHGIKEPSYREPSPSPPPSPPSRDEQLAEVLAHGDPDAIDAIEDEIEDDEVMQRIRRERMAALMAQAKGEIYGDIAQITASDFIQEVNNAPKGVWVVLYLYLESVPECELAHRLFPTIASKHRAVKFLKAVATNVIEGYPRHNVPSVLVYRDGDMVTQHHRLAIWGGMRTRAQDIERWLAGLGAIEVQMKRDSSSEDEEEEERGYRRGKVFSVSGQMGFGGRRRVADSDSD